MNSLPDQKDLPDWLGPAIDGAALLDDVHSFYCRFVAFPSDHAATACTLWVAHAHAMNAWESTPRLAYISPEPASGKTRALEITELLVPRPVAAVNVTPAYLFRKVADPDGRPTILHDEIDTVFGPKVRRDVEETRGLLNAGHRKGAVTGRCKVIGKAIATEEIEAYCAVALAGLGDLPDTVASRAVIVRMRRRAPDEQVEPFRRREHAELGHRLSVRLARWADTNEAALTTARPIMPPGVEDRPADVWEPLLAIADAAGGNWPRLAREAATALVNEASETPATLGVKLLEDIRTTFADAEQMTTVDLLARLNDLDESPWGDLKGKPLDSRKLARLLRPYGVKPVTVREHRATAKGYRAEGLWDAWQRYVSQPSVESVTSVTSVTSVSGGGPDTVDNGGGDRSDVTDVTDVTANRGNAETGFECSRCAGVGCGWCGS